MESTIRAGKKEEAVRLRQALRILSEAEKQLRTSSDQPTWLTAALLQFAPDRSYQPSSVETSVLASPVAQLNDTSEKETVGESVQPWTSEEQIHFNPDDSRDGGDGRRRNSGTYVEAKVHPAESPLATGVSTSPGERRSGRPSNARSDEPLLPGCIDDLTQKDYTVMSQRKLDEVWQRVIQGCRSNVLKQLLQAQGKLLSLLLAESEWHLLLLLTQHGLNSHVTTFHLSSLCLTRFCVLIDRSFCCSPLGVPTP